MTIFNSFLYVYQRVCVESAILRENYPLTLMFLARLRSDMMSHVGAALNEFRDFSGHFFRLLTLQ